MIPQVSDAQAVIDREAKDMPLIKVNTMAELRAIPSNAYIEIPSALLEEAGFGTGDDPDAYLDDLL